MKDRTLTLLDTKRDMIWKVAMEKNIMFLLNIEMDVPKYLNVCVKDETWFWHMRLEHVKFDGM
jgi:hypothetical protein